MAEARDAGASVWGDRAWRGLCGLVHSPWAGRPGAAALCRIVCDQRRGADAATTRMGQAAAAPAAGRCARNARTFEPSSLRSFKRIGPRPTWIRFAAALAEHASHAGWPGDAARLVAHAG